MKLHRLQLGKGTTQGFPSSAGGIPVWLTQIAGDPDIGAAQLVGRDVVQRALHHGGQICGRVRGLRDRDVEQRVRIVNGRGFIGGAVDQHDLGATTEHVRDALRDLLECGGTLRFARGQVLLLHARAAIQQHQHGVRRTPGQTQPTTRERARDQEDQAQHREHPQRQDQHLPQPRVAAIHLLRREQEHHRRPLNRAPTMQVDQMNDHRQGRQRQREEQEWGEEAHRPPFFGVRPSKNFASTSAYGSCIFTRW